MSLFNNVLDFFKNNTNQQANAVPEGVCPNCWGSQEYGKLVRDIQKDVQVEVNRGTENYAFVQAFVTKHVKGIELKNKLKGMVCEMCHPASSAG
ncbi:MAG: hypothetical protein AB8F78_18780 [Saprospiraceae bacterium]